MNNTRVDELVALIRSMEADAYERGKTDAKREIMTYLTTNATLESAPEGRDMTRPSRRSQRRAERPASDRKRTPKGITSALINRVLASHPGLTPSEMLTHAETEYEKMVGGPSLRNQLRRGRDKGWYRRSDDGRWYLIDTSKDETEGNAQKHPPSASNSNLGGPHGTALAE